MWQYHVQGFIKPIAFFFLGGVGGLSGISAGIDSPDTLERVWVSLIGIAFLGFGLSCLREIHEIRVTHEGEIIFVRVVGGIRVRAADIRRLEGRCGGLQ
jgi:hypothetical protein